MRITSELYVAQLLRRVFADGGFAAVARKGASEAGAIFVVTRGRSGALALYGPAPQSLREDAGGREFIEEPASDEAAMDLRFTREARFDPDFWVIEIEIDAPDSYLDLVEA